MMKINCPCQSTLPYDECCAPFHQDEAQPPTAEALMRSRYSAFALKIPTYLKKTTDPQTTHLFDHALQEKWAAAATFTDLQILNAIENGNKATVEFKATYEVNGETLVHHEKSKFRKQGGQWFYRDGRS